MERPYFYKVDLDSCPFVPLEELTNVQKEQIEELATRLADRESSVFTDIDQFFAQLFGLSKRDVEVVVDTLEVRDPNDELGKRGSEKISQPEADRFIKRVKQLLAPFARRINVELVIRLVGESDSSSYRFLEITDAERKPQSNNILFETILELATKTGSSRIVHCEDGRIVVGTLNQYRYWTLSRARLLAADVLREYFSAFEGAQ